MQWTLPRRRAHLTGNTQTVAVRVFSCWLLHHHNFEHSVCSLPNTHLYRFVSDLSFVLGAFRLPDLPSERRYQKGALVQINSNKKAAS